MLFALSILWGAAFLFVGIAVADLPPVTILLVRVGLAALALGSVIVIASRRRLAMAPAAPGLDREPALGVEGALARGLGAL
ncbi:MAG: hypothetical protein WD673_16590 [Alphaproteobacteria bacterium]